jgi:succinyl-CoA synthetase alpha subunit
MKWPKITSETRVLIQGMTGKEGVRMAEWMMRGGTEVAAGINPKKAGQTVHGKPIFAAVKDALAYDPRIAMSSIVVPAPFVLDAAREAFDAGIRFVHILTERVPVHDVLQLRALALAHEGIVLGPSSVGMLQFPRFRIGYVGGERPFDVLREGSLALVSVSGGMTNEMLMSLAHSGMGIRIVMHLGGDRVNGFGMEEAISACDTMEDVRAFALFAEPGNPILREIAQGRFRPRKPAAMLLPGDALESMPRGLPFGHAGTIVGEDDPPLAEVRASIRGRGIPCSHSMSDFISACTHL